MVLTNRKKDEGQIIDRNTNRQKIDNFRVFQGRRKTQKSNFKKSHSYHE